MAIKKETNKQRKHKMLLSNLNKYIYLYFVKYKLVR
jgi:hypothetical protein